MVLKNYRTLAASQDWDGTAQTIIPQLPRDFLAHHSQEPCLIVHLLSL